MLALTPLQQDNQDADVALLKYRVAAAVLPASPLLWNNIGMCFFAKQVCNMERIAAPFALCCALCLSLPALRCAHCFRGCRMRPGLLLLRHAASTSKGV